MGNSLGTTPSYLARYNRVTLVQIAPADNSTTVVLLYLIVIVLAPLTAGFVPSAFLPISAFCCLDDFGSAPLFHLAMNQMTRDIVLLLFLALLVTLVIWIIIGAITIARVEKR